MAGTQNSSIRSYNFFVESTLQGSGSYAENKHEFVDVDDQTPFMSHSILIVNDSAGDINFRFTADPGTAAPHGVIETNETLQLDFKRARRIYLAGAAGLAFRLWSW